MQINYLRSPLQLSADAEPTGPELSPIQAIHRHRDGVITFHRKNEKGEFENLFAIRSEYLEGMFPEFRERLEQDASFSLNALWNWEKGKYCLSAGQVRHQKKLRYLCACYTDLDCYNLGRSFAEVLGVIRDFEERGLIPPASVIVSSGRGMWLLWLLRDSKNPSCPPGAFPEKHLFYIRIQRAIYGRLAHLGADTAATDAMRLARVPGSWHTGAACYGAFLISQGV